MQTEELLKNLRQSLGAADFDRGLAELTASNWAMLVEGEDVDSLETKWMAAELFDYAGRYADATRILSVSGPHSTEALEDALRADRRRVSEDLRPTYKQHCLVAIQWGFTGYRREEWDSAKEQWDLCRRFVQECLKDERCHYDGTLCRVFYGLGLIHRQLNEYAEARRMFRESVDHAQQDAAGHQLADTSSGTALLEYRVAKCLGLGLGWVCYTDGSLDLAGPLINAAKMLLANKKARMIRTYVDVVQATVQMSEYGDQLPQLTEAVRTLETAYKAFKRHPAYRARTAHELALASIRMSMLCRTGDEKTLHHNKTRQYVEEVKKYAAPGEKHGKDSRWLANALIAESRLLRSQGDYEQAQVSASAALARSKNDRFTRVDARLELGQALFSRAQQSEHGGQEAAEDYHLAAAHFEKALADGYENPKIQAVCHIHLARCWLGMRNGNRASAHVEKWRGLKPRVKNAFVQGLGKDVEKEMAKFTLPFTVEWPPTASEMPDVGAEETRFRGWVTEAALSLAPHGTTDEAVKLIRRFGKSIGKATFFLWRKKAGLPKGKE